MLRELFIDLFLEAHRTAPRQITLDLDATDDPLHGEQEGRFFHGYYKSYCYLPLYIFADGICFLPSCAAPTSMPALARLKRWRGSSRRSVSAGQWSAFCCGRIQGSRATS